MRLLGDLAFLLRLLVYPIQSLIFLFLGLLSSLDIPPASADQILASADANKNALLNFHEFVHWLPATALMLQQYKQ